MMMMNWLAGRQRCGRGRRGRDEVGKERGSKMPAGRTSRRVW